mmetsp:Transcript_99787/g.251712  ORF Transcript_99787/g.251712 Transcript_99787/m.251712 type:complete len:230 (+) Transcript_99787:2-691(+)
MEVARFLLRFDVPTIGVEWVRTTDAGDGGTAGTRILTPIRLDAAQLHAAAVDAGRRAKLVEALLCDHPFLAPRHAMQLEGLMLQLASQGLPAYRIVHRSGASVVAEIVAEPCEKADFAGAGAVVVGHLPYMALLLARQRSLRADGWWIRLSTKGGGWVREGEGPDAAAVACTPTVKEAKAWLRAAEEATAGPRGRAGDPTLAARNAKAVWAQVRRSAKLASQRPSDTLS